MFFQVLTSVIAEFPNSNFISVRSYLCKKKKKIEPHVFILSILQFIWRYLAITLEATFDEGARQKSDDPRGGPSGAVPKVHPLDRRLNKKYFSKHMFLLVLQVHEIIKRSFIVAMKVHSPVNCTFSYFD